VTATDRSTAGAPAEFGPGHARRWWVLATMTACLLVVIMGNTTLNVDGDRRPGAAVVVLTWLPGRRRPAAQAAVPGHQ
jgi:hypothetical protein